MLLLMDPIFVCVGPKPRFFSSLPETNCEDHLRFIEPAGRFSRWKNCDPFVLGPVSLLAIEKGKMIV